MCQKIKLEEKCPLTEVGGWEINLSLLATSLASVLSLEEIQWDRHYHQWGLNVNAVLVWLELFHTVPVVLGLTHYSIVYILLITYSTGTCGWLYYPRRSRDSSDSGSLPPQLHCCNTTSCVFVFMFCIIFLFYSATATPFFMPLDHETVLRILSKQNTALSTFRPCKRLTSHSCPPIYI